MAWVEVFFVKPSFSAPHEAARIFSPGWVLLVLAVLMAFLAVEVCGLSFVAESLRLADPRPAVRGTVTQAYSYQQNGKFRLHVAYRYEVAGQEFTSQQDLSNESAKDSLSVGDQPLVKYDPRNPLRAEVQLMPPWVALGSGLLIMLVLPVYLAVVWCLWSRRSRRLTVLEQDGFLSVELLPSARQSIRFWTGMSGFAAAILVFVFATVIMSVASKGEMDWPRIIAKSLMAPVGMIGICLLLYYVAKWLDKRQSSKRSARSLAPGSLMKLDPVTRLLSVAGHSGNLLFPIDLVIGRPLLPGDHLLIVRTIECLPVWPRRRPRDNWQLLLVRGAAKEAFLINSQTMINDPEGLLAVVKQFNQALGYELEDPVLTLRVWPDMLMIEKPLPARRPRFWGLQATRCYGRCGVSLMALLVGLAVFGDWWRPQAIGELLDPRVLAPQRLLALSWLLLAAATVAAALAAAVSWLQAAALRHACPGMVEPVPYDFPSRSAMRKRLKSASPF